ncbi:MAG TPA: hypothetical protein VIC05_08190 [Solirubrobacteraceae bacterium]|jgi:hypothetical protein
MYLIPTLIISFLVVGLALGALAMTVRLIAKAVKGTVVRRIRFKREISGDWWTQFEHEFRHYAALEERRH